MHIPLRHKSFSAVIKIEVIGWRYWQLYIQEMRRHRLPNCTVTFKTNVSRLHFLVVQHQWCVHNKRIFMLRYLQDLAQVNNPGISVFKKSKTFPFHRVKWFSRFSHLLGSLHCLCMQSHHAKKCSGFGVNAPWHSLSVNIYTCIYNTFKKNIIYHEQNSRVYNTAGVMFKSGSGTLIWTLVRTFTRENGLRLDALPIIHDVRASTPFNSKCNSLYCPNVQTLSLIWPFSLSYSSSVQIFPPTRFPHFLPYPRSIVFLSIFITVSHVLFLIYIRPIMSFNEKSPLSDFAAQIR